jgi:hypothetical protein
LKNIYYIGGSPCSGKSTVAEAIAHKFNLNYFKVDDFLEEYVAKGVACGKPICIKQKKMTAEQTWMRDPEIQNLEELQFYNEIFEFIMKDINNIPSQDGIITEGAAFLPCLIKNSNIKQQHYVNITPTPEFQILHYKQRPWVPYVLEGCRDKEKAFMNWMDRDILFANAVRKQCEEMGYKSFINDGTISIEELVKKVCLYFNLDE